MVFILPPAVEDKDNRTIKMTLIVTKENALKASRWLRLIRTVAFFNSDIPPPARFKS
jgi:hypothetical protein